MNHAVVRLLTFIPLFTLSGCAMLDRGFGVAPMALGILRLPVTVTTNMGKNGPLTGYDRGVLGEMSDDALMDGKNPLGNARLNEPVIFSYGKPAGWVSKSRSCYRPPFKEVDVIEPFSGLTQFDDIRDLKDPPNDTLLFVALSGGGVRAAMLAQATLVQLERKFNSFKKAVSPEHEPETGKFSSLLDSINVISTVSGGSLYAYRMARVKSLIENEKGHIESVVEDIVRELNNDAVTPVGAKEKSQVYIPFRRPCPDAEQTAENLKKAQGLYSSDPSRALGESAEILNRYLKYLERSKDNFFECTATSQYCFLCRI